MEFDRYGMRVCLCVIAHLVALKIHLGKSLPLKPKCASLYLRVVVVVVVVVVSGTCRQYFERKRSTGGPGRGAPYIKTKPC